MNKDTLNHLKKKIITGLETLSSVPFHLKKDNFDAYLNTYLMLAIKLNHALINEPETILKRMPQQIEQANIVHLTNGLSELGFIAQQSRGCKNVRKLSFPCLLMQGNHFKPNQVKILFKENEQVIVYDPYLDQYETYNKLSIGRDYTVYTFEHFDSDKYDLGKGVLRFLDRSWFMALLGRFRMVIFKLVFISMLLHLFSLSLPLFIIYTYNRVVLSHDASNMTLVTLSVLVMLILEQLLRFYKANVLSWLGSRVDYIVTNQVLKKISNLPLYIIEQLSLPSQIARIRSFSSLRDFFTGPIFSSLLEFPGIVMMILLLSYIHYLFTLIFALGFLAIGICLFIFHKVLSGQIKKATMINTEKYYLTSLFLDKLPLLHYQGLENYYTNRLAVLSEQAASYDMRSEYSSSFVDNFGKYVTNIGILITLCVGIFLIWHQQISVAALLATIFLSWRIFSPIQIISSTMVRSEKIYRTIQQIDNFLALPDDNDSQHLLTRCLTIKGYIRFTNVGVFYTSNKHFVLRNFSLSIKPSSITVIQGEGGSGKSTLLKLIARHVKPNIGKILIDQYDIAQLDIDSLRRQICYIHQADHYIQGTFYDNILISNPVLTKADIDGIARYLKLEEEFNKLPEGLSTNINAENLPMIPKTILKAIDLMRLYGSQAPIKLIDGIEKESFTPKTWKLFLSDLKKWRDSATILIASEDPLIVKMADEVVKLS